MDTNEPIEEPLAEDEVVDESAASAEAPAGGASPSASEPGGEQRKLLLSLEKVLRSYRLYEARGTQYDAHVNELASHA
ncbi:MAG TPA: hypothetical protein DIU15_05440, partial [Deltaproteobacteria bacterium]|nr:hypothetical protein [Deltaproteobacteria bacterium]